MLVKIVRIGFFITLVASSLPPNPVSINVTSASTLDITKKAMQVSNSNCVICSCSLIFSQ